MNTFETYMENMTDTKSLIACWINLRYMLLIMIGWSLFIFEVKVTMKWINMEWPHKHISAKISVFLWNLAYMLHMSPLIFIVKRKLSKPSVVDFKVKGQGHW